MQYISTRDREQQFSASQAIARGLAEDGGLLTPVYLPKLPRRALEELKDMSYQQRAVYVMKLFLDGFSVKELTDFANAAYGPEKFDTPAVAPVRQVDDTTFCLDLDHLFCFLFCLSFFPAADILCSMDTGPSCLL